jgi:hypothetical protein
MRCWGGILISLDRWLLDCPCRGLLFCIHEENWIDPACLDGRNGQSPPASSSTRHRRQGAVDQSSPVGQGRRSIDRGKDRPRPGA